MKAALNRADFYYRRLTSGSYYKMDREAYLHILYRFYLLAEEANEKRENPNKPLRFIVSKSEYRVRSSSVQKEGIQAPKCKQVSKEDIKYKMCCVE